MSSLSYFITILLFRPKVLNKNTYNADKKGLCKVSMAMVWCEGLAVLYLNQNIFIFI